MLLENTRKILVSGFYGEPGIFLYSDSVDRYSIFARYFRQGVRHSERCLYAYYHTKLRSSFQTLIEDELLQIYELRNNLSSLPEWIEECCEAADRDVSVRGIRFVLDFSRTDDPDFLQNLRKYLRIVQQSFPLSGIIAFNINTVPNEILEGYREDFPQVMVATGEEMVVSFSKNSLPPRNLEVVDQDVVEDIVKKMLEPLILTSLSRPVSGYEILHEINERFNVQIPMARVYSYLYKLEESNYLEVKCEGRSRIYASTPKGKLYIEQRIREIHAVIGTIAGEYSQCINKSGD